MKKEENKKRNAGIAAATVAATAGAVLAGVANMNDEEVVDNNNSNDKNLSDTDTEDIIELQPLTEEQLTADELENVVEPQSLSHENEVETHHAASHEDNNVSAEEHVVANEHNPDDDSDIVENLDQETESELDTANHTEYHHEDPVIPDPQEDPNEWQDEIDKDEQMASLTRESDPTLGEQLIELGENIMEKADELFHGNSTEEMPDIVNNADTSAWN